MGPLREALLEHAPPSVQASLGEHPALDEQLQALWSNAVAKWPGVELSAAGFGAALGQRLGEPVSLSDLRASDVYLAAALLEGIPEALRAFEAEYGAEIDRGLRRLDPEGIDDLRQQVRQRLLVGDGTRPPKLASYGGRGELLRWLRVTVVRMRADVARRRRREPEPVVGALGSRLSAAVSPSSDPELRYLKDHYGDQLRVAFEGAVEQLGAKERNLLRQHLLGGLSATQLAGLYNVDRSTTKRWLARAREQLWGRTRGRVMEQLGLSADEFESIVRLVHSELHLSIPRLLGPATGPGPADPPD
ncbi:MAG: transcriptional regulator [Nannocystaceae bacterium]